LKHAIRLGSGTTTCLARSAKLMASGEVDDTLLEALEDYVKRAQKLEVYFRLGG